MTAMLNFSPAWLATPRKVTNNSAAPASLRANERDIRPPEIPCRTTWLPLHEATQGARDPAEGMFHCHHNLMRNETAGGVAWPWTPLRRGATIGAPRLRTAHEIQ